MGAGGVGPGSFLFCPLFPLFLLGSSVWRCVVSVSFDDDGSGSVRRLVRSSEGLGLLLARVAAEPGGWESSLGVVVAAAVVDELPRRVGPGRLAGRSDGLSGAEALGLLRSEVLDVLMVHPSLVAGAAEGDLWGWLVRRALWALERGGAEACLHGVCGDVNLCRLRERVRREGVVIGSLSDEEVGWREHEARPVVGVPASRCEWFVEVGDLGPVLGRVVEGLVEAGTPEGPAGEGTARVAAIAARWRPTRRHSRARRDAREGVLSGLGASEAAAGAWMSLVAGSRRGGVESSMVWAVYRGEAGGGAWAAAHRQWLGCVAAGVRPEAVAEGRGGSSRAAGLASRSSGLSEQLALFGEGWCLAVA